MIFAWFAGLQTVTSKKPSPTKLKINTLSCYFREKKKKEEYSPRRKIGKTFKNNLRDNEGDVETLFYFYCCKPLLL